MKVQIWYWGCNPAGVWHTIGPHRVAFLQVWLGQRTQYHKQPRESGAVLFDSVRPNQMESSLVSFSFTACIAASGGLNGDRSGEKDSCNVQCSRTGFLAAAEASSYFDGAFTHGSHGPARRRWVSPFSRKLSACANPVWTIHNLLPGFSVRSISISTSMTNNHSPRASRGVQSPPPLPQND